MLEIFLSQEKKELLLHNLNHFQFKEFLVQMEEKDLGTAQTLAFFGNLANQLIDEVTSTQTKLGRGNLQLLTKILEKFLLTFLNLNVRMSPRTPLTPKYDSYICGLCKHEIPKQNKHNLLFKGKLSCNCCLMNVFF